MLTARSFIGALLIVFVVGCIVFIALSPLDGATLTVTLTIGLINLLPRPVMPEPGRRHDPPPDPDRDEDIWWAEDWSEPLVRYRFGGSHGALTRTG